MKMVMVVTNASLLRRSTSLARAASAAIKPGSQSLGVGLEGAWDTHPETRAAATTITTCALQTGPGRSTGVTVVLSGSAAASTHWADAISSPGVVPAHRHPRTPASVRKAMLGITPRSSATTAAAALTTAHATPGKGGGAIGAYCRTMPAVRGSDDRIRSYMMI